MPPRPNTTDDIEVIHSDETHAEVDLDELPFVDRLKYRFNNLINSTRLFIYNSKEQTILGTTSTSWLKISIYYLFFYICLALFYCGMVAVFGAIISRESPRYLYHNSQMNDNGKCHIGVGFRPMPGGTDISITVYNDTTSQQSTISSLENYRFNFLTQTDLTYVEECSPTQPASTLPTGYSCQFSWTDVVPNDAHPCSKKNNFGWPLGQPCVLIKLNQIYGWVPDSGDVTDKVANWTGNPVLPVDKAEQNIYITCNGVDATDVDAMGNMTYYSVLHPLGNPYYGGLPYYFFPYRNSREYVQPFVLVQFTSLALDQLVNIECRAWAPNIDQSSEGTQSRGMVAFNIFRTNRTSPANA